jgi:malate synthase
MMQIAEGRDRREKRYERRDKRYERRDMREEIKDMRYELRIENKNKWKRLYNKQLTFILC